MEIVPDDISPVELREEVNSRTHRAGYTKRDGSPVHAGKGDRFRTVNTSRYADNYKRIFGHK